MYFDLTFTNSLLGPPGQTFQVVLSGSSLEAALLGFRRQYPTGEITSVSINRSARREFPAHELVTCQDMD